jgi:hypothetical protein
VSLKRRYISTKLQGAIYHKAVILSSLFGKRRKESLLYFQFCTSFVPTVQSRASVCAKTEPCTGICGVSTRHYSSSLLKPATLTDIHRDHVALCPVVTCCRCSTRCCMAPTQHVFDSWDISLMLGENDLSQT